ncbi:diaminopimelate epimerase [Azotosporobacter soli]|uniref:diaminopimelate epimerase n=1 Tax=Azotosporobacter soli TaxID=3055040 RepID=UPI0031FE65C6
MNFKFSKWHGLGNDFVIVNGFEQHGITDYAKAAIEVCDRNFGIGADGLVFVLPSKTADFQMRIFNSDGSEAEMCGNVTRCVARYVYDNGLSDKTAITLETKAGIIKPQLIFQGEKLQEISVDMGEPRLKQGEIPMTQGAASDAAVDLPLTVNGKTWQVTCVSMGNPHCVIFVPDVAALDLAALGPALETANWFPRKTNVEFVQVLNTRQVRMRVWERGAGITLACGTGACATTVAAVLNKKTEREVKVDLDGGSLKIRWAEDNHVHMAGPAVEVFRGEYQLR